MAGLQALWFSPCPPPHEALQVGRCFSHTASPSPTVGRGKQGSERGSVSERERQDSRQSMHHVGDWPWLNPRNSIRSSKHH